MDLIAASTAYQSGRWFAVAVLALLCVTFVRRAAQRPAGRSRLAYAIAAIVVAGMVIGNLAGLTGDKEPLGNDSRARDKDRVHRGGRTSSGGQVDCDCAFDQITSRQAYDTPDEFSLLAAPVAAAQRSQDPSQVPPVLITAMQSCIVPAPAGT